MPLKAPRRTKPAVPRGSRRGGRGLYDPAAAKAQAHWPLRRRLRRLECAKVPSAKATFVCAAGEARRSRRPEHKCQPRSAPKPAIPTIRRPADGTGAGPSRAPDPRQARQKTVRRCPGCFPRQAGLKATRRRRGTCGWSRCQPFRRHLGGAGARPGRPLAVYGWLEIAVTVAATHHPNQRTFAMVALTDCALEMTCGCSGGNR